MNPSLSNIEVHKLQETGNKKITIKKDFPYPANQYWVIKFEEGKLKIFNFSMYKNRGSELQPGKYSLAMIFKGNIGYDNTGFYKHVFENKQNTNDRNHSIPMAATRFKPTFARKAFPCFDEPSFKSTFNLSLVKRSKTYIALSNMDVEQRILDDPKKGETKNKHGL